MINPTYVLRERKNNDEIEIAHFNSGTYVNVDKKRPCYENLDPPTPTPLTRLARSITIVHSASCHLSFSENLSFSEHLCNE